MSNVIHYAEGKYKEFSSMMTKERPLREGERKVRGYGVYAADQSLKPYNYISPPLAADHVEIRISYCGVCPLDVGMINNIERGNEYPFIPGHEIVGHISKLGEAVDDLEEGQCVGVGFYKDSCGECDYCTNGKENLCSVVKQTCGKGSNGGFADYIQVSERWVIPIPEELPPESTPPLLCSGVLAFAALSQLPKNVNRLWRERKPEMEGEQHFYQKGEKQLAVKGESSTETPTEGAGPSSSSRFSEYDEPQREFGRLHEAVKPDASESLTKERRARVGVLGFGGVGHIFVQMAYRLGYEVYVFSSDDSKEPDARRLGGAHFIHIHNFGQKKEAIKESLDLILISAAPMGTIRNLNWSDYLYCLRPHGILCLTGYFPRFSLEDAQQLITKHRQILGINGGSPRLMSQVLDFCAKHRVRSECDVFSIKHVGPVYDRWVRNSKKFETYRIIFKVEGEIEEEPKTPPEAQEKVEGIPVERHRYRTS
eukprot:gb/GECH01000759.1/.p1 GENE.gb/GECH01000759.1/~~gb/GECH01000759.1/.p1  ORF type:complete len:482 (+),score=134.75 gb/GECH01000759.1/:1-1446(+)